MVGEESCDECSLVAAIEIEVVMPRPLDLPILEQFRHTDLVVELVRHRLVIPPHLVLLVIPNTTLEVPTATVSCRLSSR